MKPEIERPILTAADGGTARLLGLGYAVARRIRRGQPVDVAYQEACQQGTLGPGCIEDGGHPAPDGVSRPKQGIGGRPETFHHRIAHHAGKRITAHEAVPISQVAGHPYPLPCHRRGRLGQDHGEPRAGP